VRYRDLIAARQPSAVPPTPPHKFGHPPSLERPAANRPWRNSGQVDGPNHGNWAPGPHDLGWPGSPLKITCTAPSLPASRDRTVTPAAPSASTLRWMSCQVTSATPQQGQHASVRSLHLSDRPRLKLVKSENAPVAVRVASALAALSPIGSAGILAGRGFQPGVGRL